MTTFSKFTECCRCVKQHWYFCVVAFSMLESFILMNCFIYLKG